MIIGIDGNEANVERKVGISEYAFELLCGFEKLATENRQFKIYLKKSPNSSMPKENEYFKYVVFGPKKLWTQIALPLKLKLSKQKPNVFFTPSHYAPRFINIPYVISIMDVSYLLYQEYFNKKDLYQLVKWTAYSVKKAKKVLTISKSSKNDILKKYHLEPEKVDVTYPGIKNLSLNPSIYEMKHLVEKFNISDNYFLFVGTLQPRKNIVRLIEAFSKIKHKEDKGNLQLLIVGKKGWKYDEIVSSPLKYGVTDSVKFLDFVKDEELSVLYKNAICYVLPSLYEGFGLPILEAYQNGCPVITSNISSMPEAAGKGAILIDPESVNEISEAMEKLLNDKEFRNKLIDEGKTHLKNFSWEKASKETIIALEDLVKN